MSRDEEVFVPVAGWEGRYEVSNFGRVRSLRGRGIPGRVVYLKPRWTKTGPRNNGRYCIARLVDTATQRDVQVAVHRLVALAFAANPDAKNRVNHIDGNTENNRADNLEWVTQSENLRHAWATGLRDKRNQRAMASGLAPRWRHADGREFHGTIVMLTRAFPDEKLQSSSLSRVASGRPRYHTHKGWTVVRRAA